MSDKIPLTVRLPLELHEQLKYSSKILGFTKTNLIKLSIYEYLDVETIEDLHNAISKYDTGDKFRLVLNVNQYTYELLEKKSKENNISINSLLIYSSSKSLKHYSSMIEKLMK